MLTLRSLVADVDDMVGRELEPGGALSLAMDCARSGSRRC
jgi:hypothetical protein